MSDTHEGALFSTRFPSFSSFSFYVALCCPCVPNQAETGPAERSRQAGQPLSPSQKQTSTLLLVSAARWRSTSPSPLVCPLVCPLSRHLILLPVFYASASLLPSHNLHDIGTSEKFVPLTCAVGGVGGAVAEAPERLSTTQHPVPKLLSVRHLVCLNPFFIGCRQERCPRRVCCFVSQSGSRPTRPFLCFVSFQTKFRSAVRCVTFWPRAWSQPRPRSALRRHPNPMGGAADLTPPQTSAPTR